MTRLVTFLGIPQKPKDTATTVHEGYQLTTYCRYDADGVPTEQNFKTPWIAIALAEFFSPSEAHVLATEEAWNDRPPGANRSNGEALAHELGRRGVAVERVLIPTGLSAAELWQQFEVLKSSLRGPKKGQIVLDITHGLRNQPFFAGAVVAFVAMIDEERPGLRVVYGAHDLIRTLNLDHAPVLDLTPFVELLDWTHDLVLFLKSGRLGRLIRRVREPGRTLHERWQNGVRLATALEAFARDLQTIRTGSLLLGRADDRGRRSSSSARQLLEAVERARDDVANQLPPLADVLDRVDGMARELAFEGDSLSGESGRRALLALTDVYLRMGRYIEAITTLREGRITAWSAPAAARPGLPGFDEDERRYTENRLWRQAEPNEQEAIAGIRNDLDHAGYRRGPLGAADLIENIRKQRDAFARLSPPPRPQENRIFVNISNHPSADWPEEQHRAALDLAGRVEDIPFPEVGPDWSLRRLEDEADRIAGALPPETTHAMVQGEFTLTAALVRRLQQKGIRCLAATTERRVERTEDGREVRSFRFVRFREYPRLA